MGRQWRSSWFQYLFKNELICLYSEWTAKVFVFIFRIHDIVKWITPLCVLVCVIRFLFIVFECWIEKFNDTFDFWLLSSHLDFRYCFSRRGLSLMAMKAFSLIYWLIIYDVAFFENCNFKNIKLRYDDCCIV